MDHKYTFDGDNRYITIGIADGIPIEIQLFIWNEIDWLVRESQKVDYLQVFEISIKEEYLVIEHRQEQPPLKKTYRLQLIESFKEMGDVTIFVIDDIDHSTMLLASEY